MRIVKRDQLLLAKHSHWPYMPARHDLLPSIVGADRPAVQQRLGRWRVVLVMTLLQPASQQQHQCCAQGRAGLVQPMGVF